VLLGPNSAGKSSFLQALAALHFLRRLKVSPATLAPLGANFSSWPLDFGTRQTLQRQGTLHEGGVRIQIRNSENGNDTEIAYEFGRGPSGESLDLSAVEIEETQAAGAAQGGVHEGAAVAVTTPIAVEAEEGVAEHPLTDKISVREVGDGFWQGPGGEAVVASFKNLKLDYYNRREGGTLVAVTSTGQKHLLEALERVRYLRPSRAEPCRHSESRPAMLPDDDVGPTGEWAGQTWLARREREVQFRAPPPPRLDRATATRLLAEPKRPAETIAFESAVDRWMAHLGVAKGALAERTGGGAVSVRADVDGQHRGLPDVGFGVSQVLPIIVQGLALPKGGTLLVEQPEAQLHPRPQAQLADFFCALVEEGCNCVIETHSEAFFRRLHLRTLLDPELASQVAVYFVDPVNADGCSEPALVPLDAEGAIRWPKEFLSESTRAHAAFAAVRAAIAQRDSVNE
jgi:hypothetical protein